MSKGKVLTRREFLRAAAITSAGLVVAACAPTPVPTPALQTVKETVVVAGTPQIIEKVITPTPKPKGGSITLSGSTQPSGLDPHVQTVWEMLYVLTSVYDPLVWVDPSGKLVPGLASSWKVSDDGKTYTFNLRKDVKFHDGTPFNAQAVKFNIDRITDPKTKSQKAIYLLGPYDSSEVVDDYTFNLKLKEPYADLLAGMSMSYVAMTSPAAVKAAGDQYEMHQVGTGPFKMKEFVPKDHVTLVPNPDYNWGPSFFKHTGAPYLQQITWKFLADPATRAPALMAGDVDVAMNLAPTDGNVVMNDPRLKLDVVKMTGQPLFWFMNITKSPTDDLKVRQAILYGTDRQSMINAALRGFFTPAYGPLSVATPEYNPDLTKMYPYDVAKAKALLDDAGWKMNVATGVREKAGTPLSLKMVSQTWGNIPPLAALLQGQLRQLGFDVQMESMTYPAQLDAGAKGDRNMPVMGGSGYFASDSMTPYFASSNAKTGFNWSKVTDPDLDALLTQGSRAIDPLARKDAYGKAQQKIMDQALILPIYDYVMLNGVNKKVAAVSYDRLGIGVYLYDAYVSE